TPKNVLALTPVDASGKPLGGTCMTAAGVGASGCGTCGLAEEKMTFVREETTRRGFPTPNGIPGGPCHVHMTHAHTIGPDGSLYACPGVTGEKALSTGHIVDRHESCRFSWCRGVGRLHLM